MIRPRGIRITPSSLPRPGVSHHVRRLKSQAQFQYSDIDGSERKEEPSSGFTRSGIPTPRQLSQFLDYYVVGQERAKRVLSVAVFNHYNRVRLNLSDWEESDASTSWSEQSSGVLAAHIHPHPNRTSITHSYNQRNQHNDIEKSNVLVIGPTGSGKTLLAKTLARVLDVPFSQSDATSFTQAGYVGEDVDMCIHRLLISSGWDVRRAGTGIVYIDEVDKIARKTGGIDGQRDVGGEGVQQALLRIMEGTTVTINAKPPASFGTDFNSMNDGRSRSSQRAAPDAGRNDSFTIDTTNILFILSGAFVGLDTILKRKIAKGSIGFTAKLASTDDTKHSFPFFTPNNNSSLSDGLEGVEPEDLVKYGFIPEFMGRLPIITTLSQLSTSDLLRVLKDVRGCLVSQYEMLFKNFGVEIRFTTLALQEICKQAADRGGGARGLRGIMERLLLDTMFEVPGSSVKHVLINQAVARGKEKALYWNAGGGAAFWLAWAEEERTMAHTSTS